MNAKRGKKAVIGRIFKDNHTTFVTTALAFLFLMLGLVSTGYGDILIGDWESSDSNDGWIPGPGDGNAILVPACPNGVTSGSGALRVTPSATGNFWTLEWEGGAVDLTDVSLQFDLTMVASEWNVGVWTKVADKIAINSDVDQGAGSGWKEWNNLAAAIDRDSGSSTGLDWGRWWDTAPDVHKRFTLDVSDYNWEGATWMQVHISTQGVGGSFYFDNVRFLLPPMTIGKCKVKAGKVVEGVQGNDSLEISGIANYPNDLNDINEIDIAITSLNDDVVIYEETIDFNAAVANEDGKFSYSYKVPKGAEGAITSLKCNFVKNTFAIKMKNVDLTGLASPLQLDITMGETTLTGEATETIINGSKYKQRIPTRLMRTYLDKLIVDKAKVKASDVAASDSLSVKGEIAVVDVADSNLVNTGLVIYWADQNELTTQTITVPGAYFVPAKSGNVYKCSKAPADEGGLVSGKFDLDKCKYSLTVKETDLGVTSGDVKFGLTLNSFDEVADVNLALGY